MFVSGPYCSITFLEVINVKPQSKYYKFSFENAAKPYCTSDCVTLFLLQTPNNLNNAVIWSEDDANAEGITLGAI